MVGVRYAEIEDDVWVLLTWFYSVDWDDASLGELRRGMSDPGLLRRLQAAARALVERGWSTVEVLTGRTKGQPVGRAEALAAIDDSANWRLPGEAGFDGSGSFFRLVPTRTCEEIFQATVDAGRPLAESILLR
jgi:hypothetical protein